jgi:stage V sporulation protein B
VTEDPKHHAAGRGALYLAASNVYFIFAGMAIQFGLPAVLSRATFGSYTIVNSIASWFNNVLVTGTIQAVSRTSAAEPEKARAVEAAGLRMHARIAIGLAIAFAAAAPGIAWFEHDSSLTAPLMLASLIVAGYAFYAVFVGTANGMHRFGVQAGLTVVFATIRAGALIGMGVIGAGVIGVIGGWVAAVAVILVLTVWWVGLPGKIVPALKQPVSPMAKYFVRVAIYLVLFNAIMFVDANLLKRILSEHLATLGLAKAEVSRLSDVQVGYYGAVQNLARLSYQVLIAATFVAFPLISRSTFSNDKSATKQYVGVIARYSLIAGALIAVVMAAVPAGVLGLVYAPDFVAAGSAALPFLALGNIAFSLIAVAGAILNGAGETRAASMTVAFTLVLAIVGNYVGISMAVDGGHALEVAAAATGGAMVVGAIACGLVLHRKFGAFVPWATVLRVGLAIAAAMLVGRYFPLHAKLVNDPKYGMVASGLMNKVRTLVVAVAAVGAYVVVLVGTRELGRADLTRVLAMRRKKT